MPKTKKESKDLSLFVVTREGVAKKMDPESFRDVRRSGIIAIKLDGSDELFSAHLVNKGEEIILATEKGQSIRFKESDVRQMGRGAGGVTAIRLGKGDKLVGADVVSKEGGAADFLVITANGFGKKTKLKEYKVQKRAGSGIKTAKLTPKTGQLIKALVLNPSWTELIACSRHGQVIRLNLSEIPSLGRQTQGVRIMKPRAGDSLASLTCL